VLAPDTFLVAALRLQLVREEEAEAGERAARGAGVSRQLGQLARMLDA